MNPEEIEKKVEELLEKAKKRNFKQSYEISIVLKDIDPTKEKIDEYIVLPHKIGDIKICAIVSDSLAKEAEKHFDLVLKKSDLEKIAGNKRECKKIARNYKYFVCEAPLMPLIGKYLGKYLAPRKKLPSMKSGFIFKPGADLLQLKEKVQRTVHVVFDKKHRVINLKIGEEGMEKKALVENISSLFKSLCELLPQGRQNIKEAYLKLTMSPSVKIW